jgi:hypothetical protein
MTIEQNVRDEAARMHKLDPRHRHPMQWAIDLKERERRGDRLTAAQRDMWRAALNDHRKFIKPSKA